jgi:hypothetical protein
VCCDLSKSAKKVTTSLGDSHIVKFGVINLQIMMLLTFLLFVNKLLRGEVVYVDMKCKFLHLGNLNIFRLLKLIYYSVHRNCLSISN